MLRVERLLSPLFIFTLTGTCQKDTNDVDQLWVCKRERHESCPRPADGMAGKQRVASASRRTDFRGSAGRGQ